MYANSIGDPFSALFLAFFFNCIGTASSSFLHLLLFYGRVNRFSQPILHQLINSVVENDPSKQVFIESVLMCVESRSPPFDQSWAIASKLCPISIGTNLEFGHRRKAHSV